MPGPIEYVATFVNPWERDGSPLREASHPWDGCPRVGERVARPDGSLVVVVEVERGRLLRDPDAGLWVPVRATVMPAYAAGNGRHGGDTFCRNFDGGRRYSDAPDAVALW